MAARMTMTPREWGLLGLLSLLWGGSFFFVAVAVKELPPLTLVALAGRASRPRCMWAMRSADRRFAAQGAAGRSRRSRCSASATTRCRSR
jgi:hypothetical protein